MAVLIGAASKPLDADALKRLTEKSFDWPPPVKLDTDDRLPMHRGGNAVDLIVGRIRRSPEVFDFSRDFKRELEELVAERLLETYYAVMFPWFDGPPQGSATP